MPFICFDADNVIIHAGRCTGGEWERLRSEWRTLALRMACCPAAAIPVVHETGTRFFRHHPGEDCGSESESLEHQSVKADAAVAAQAAGWSVAIEGGGTAPGGEKWRADVLCVRGEERIALEVQMSRQTREEYWRRQAVYASSGVKGVWFAGHKGFEPHWSTPDLPIFPIRMTGLKADVRLGRGRHRDPEMPVERFVGEFLRGLWHCREPIAAPAVIVPELAVCLDCGREVLTGPAVAAFPGEADPAYPSGPIFARTLDLDIADTATARSAWSSHRIIAPPRKGMRCPYCSGRLCAPIHFTPERLCKAQHCIQERHGSILLTAGGWWRRGEPLIPKGWMRPETPPGDPISLTSITERSRRRLTAPLHAVRARREAVLSAIRSAIADQSGWRLLLNDQGIFCDGDDPGNWIADIVLEETVPGGRRMAFFLAFDTYALPRCRLYAQRAANQYPDSDAVLLSPALNRLGFSKRVLDIPMTGGSKPLVSVNDEMVTLARFAADLVRGSLVVMTSVRVPYSLLPAPSSCSSCGRTKFVEGFVALHFGEDDSVFGNSIVVVPAPSSWFLSGGTPVGGWRASGAAQSPYCVCGARLRSNVTAEVLLEICGDLQVRHGRWRLPVGPLVWRGTIPLPPDALGHATGHRTWTLDGWESHIGAVAPPPDGDAVAKRRAVFDSLLRGAEATGWRVDASHADQGVVLVRSRTSRVAIAVLTTLPGPEADHRQAAEIRAADAVLRDTGAEEIIWLSMMPDPPLPRGHWRQAILLGWLEDAAYALPARDDPVPLDRFVQDILEGGWEYISEQPLSLTLVPERVRCAHCGSVSAIAPWCAATAAGRPAPSFARILGTMDGGMRLLPLDTAESLRRSAKRQLRLPSFQIRDGAVVQTCVRCGNILLPTLSGETLRQRWTGPGVGFLQVSVGVHRWCRLGEPILTGSLTVAGRPSRGRMTLEQWFAAATPQQLFSDWEGNFGQ
ncbi:competence protein CoiA family protein [Azospirillum argentinense]|uniref:Competence protein CoiA nuclease-like domain-containing protein n=1 Tax=Azospirillum brasilense TaxID=192 RepID=A0A4D8QDV5_AZOBR|nr:hypothetical protein [Azospirillum argentinense]QCO07431.1 hypothetical protein D3867_36720 [Azospirillum argentinense]